MKVIDAIGIPLGLLPNPDYDEKIVEAQPGDVFIFLSDGIMEACNRDDEEFGYPLLAAAMSECHQLTATEISDFLLQALASHCGDVEPSDDQTLMVMRVSGTT
jgi:serine phosphatase RsbU (regulator of sigma subunit)